GPDDRSPAECTTDQVSVVMPGHIGTGFRINSLKVQTSNDSDDPDVRQIAQARARLTSMGKDASALSDEEIKAMLAERARRFLADAPTSAAEAATIILERVKADRMAHPGRIGRPPDGPDGARQPRSRLRGAVLRPLRCRGRLACGTLRPLLDRDVAATRSRSRRSPTSAIHFRYRTATVQARRFRAFRLLRIPGGSRRPSA